MRFGHWTLSVWTLKKDSMKLFVFLSLIFSIGLLQAQDTLRLQEGLRYIRLKEGSGELPKQGDKLKVRYKGTLPDGTVFEELAPDQTYSFKLGEKSVIAGWEIGFANMKKGEKGILIIPPTLAYGLYGVADPETDGKYIVPPDATLRFEVELVDFK
jgi:FKBP-type peptidyl-prolyl cis-trans isomerase